VVVDDELRWVLSIRVRYLLLGLLVPILIVVVLLLTYVRWTQ